VGLDIANRGSRWHIGAGLGHGDDFGLALHARSQEDAGRARRYYFSRCPQNCINGVRLSQGRPRAASGPQCLLIAKHCAGGVSVKRTAVSVLGEGSAILIQKSAPLRDADIYAARQSHVAFVIEQAW